MKEEELAEIRHKLAKVAKILATPLDFDQLVNEGHLKRIGTSYYTDNIHGLPEDVSKKIKSATPTKNGLKVTFYKETKAMKKLAEDMKHLRDE